jgi:anti-sigma regulatory factor (Ser/Thr protein kinase)
VQTGPGGEPDLRHAAVVYWTPDEFVTTVHEFAQAGISAGEPTCVAATGPNLELLRARRPELAEHVSYADMTVTGVNPGRLLSAIHRFADQHPGARMRYFQEPLWPGQTADQHTEAIRHEALLNLALASHPIMVLCAYDSRLTAVALASTGRTHPHLVSAGSWRPNPGYAADPVIPAEFDRPLLPVPASAAILTYHDNLAAPRRFTFKTARQFGLEQQRATDLVLAVGELTANTWRHTAGPGTVAIWRAGEEVICQVSDTGHITNLLAGTRRPQPTGAGGGRGLWLVHQLCDLVEVRSSPAGTSVRLHMQLDPRAG